MPVVRTQLIPLSCIVALVSAGCAFSSLKDDLERVDELHVVAHSMGGLVSRGTFNQCMMASICSDFGNTAYSARRAATASSLTARAKQKTDAY